MGSRVSRLVSVAVCAAVLAALPVLASCSSVVSAANSVMNPSSSASSEAVNAYYLGIDEHGYLALYRGEPGDGSEPIRTTDIVVADLHESVVAGLKEGMVFDSFNEAIERIGDYREAAEAAAKAREAEEDANAAADEAAANVEEENAGATEQGAEAEAQEAAKAEADELDAAAAQEAPSDQGSSDSQAPAESAAPSASESQDSNAQAGSDEIAPAGEFWGVWLGTYSDLDEAYAVADRAKEQGFNPEVFEVTNWDGVNYVVGVGEFASKSEAERVLVHATELGYTSAYLHTAARQ